MDAANLDIETITAKVLAFNTQGVNDTWLIKGKDKDFGPFDKAKIQGLIVEGKVKPASLLKLDEGETEWRKAGELECFAADFKKDLSTDRDYAEPVSRVIAAVIDFGIIVVAQMALGLRRRTHITESIKPVFSFSAGWCNSTLDGTGCGRC
jgi:hypothetical protein